MNRVLVTRQATGMATLGAALSAAGLEATCLPLIETRPLEDTGRLDEAIAALASYDWIVFASASAARLFAARAAVLGANPATLQRPQICAGPVTAQALAEWGWPSGRIVAPFTAEGARDVLLPLAGAGTRVLLPRAEDGRDVIAPALRQQGAVVDEVPLYRTVARPEAAQEAVQRLSAREFGAVLFFSPSAVRVLRDAAGGAAAVRLLDGVAAGCIGPTTASAVAAAGWHPAVVAPDTTAGSLVRAVAAYLLSGDAGTRSLAGPRPLAGAGASSGGRR